MGLFVFLSSRMTQGAKGDHVMKGGVLNELEIFSMLISCLLLFPVKLYVGQMNCKVGGQGPGNDE